MGIHQVVDVDGTSLLGHCQDVGEAEGYGRGVSQPFDGRTLEEGRGGEGRGECGEGGEWKAIPHTYICS